MFLKGRDDMDGISNSIIGASMQMSSLSVQNAVDLYTIGKAMDIQTQQVTQLLGDFSQANPTPPAVDGLGASLDVSA